MAATALPAAASFTGASVTEGQFKTAITDLRTYLAYLFNSTGEKKDAITALRMLGASTLLNLGLSPSVAANALTINVVQYEGSTPSADNPVSIGFRSTNIATGLFNLRRVEAALSLVISSGSTLGHVSGTDCPIYVYAMDFNSGTVELAVSTKYFGESGLMSTTAEGGGGAADSATVAYSASARSGLPFRCIGRFISNQATAGTWAAVPTETRLDTGAVLDKFTTRAQADQSITSNTTLASATNMSFTIESREEWVADFDLDVGDALNVTGHKWAVTVPAGATLNVIAHAGTDAVNTASGNYVYRTTTGGAALDFTASNMTGAARGLIRISVWVLNGATAGTVQLQIAQSTSSGTALVLRKGSHMRANRIISG